MARVAAQAKVPLVAKSIPARAAPRGVATPAASPARVTPARGAVTLPGGVRPVLGVEAVAFATATGPLPAP